MPCCCSIKLTLSQNLTMNSFKLCFYKVFNTLTLLFVLSFFSSDQNPTKKKKIGLERKQKSNRIGSIKNVAYCNTLSGAHRAEMKAQTLWLNTRIICSPSMQRAEPTQKTMNHVSALTHHNMTTASTVSNHIRHIYIYIYKKEHYIFLLSNNHYNKR